MCFRMSVGRVVMIVKTVCNSRRGEMWLFTLNDDEQHSIG